MTRWHTLVWYKGCFPRIWFCSLIQWPYNGTCSECVYGISALETNLPKQPVECRTSVFKWLALWQATSKTPWELHLGKWMLPECWKCMFVPACKIVILKFECSIQSWFGTLLSTSSWGFDCLTFLHLSAVALPWSLDSALGWFAFTEQAKKCLTMWFSCLA